MQDWRVVGHWDSNCGGWVQTIVSGAGPRAGVASVSEKARQTCQLSVGKRILPGDPFTAVPWSPGSAGNTLYFTCFTDQTGIIYGYRRGSAQHFRSSSSPQELGRRVSLDVYQSLPVPSPRSFSTSFLHIPVGVRSPRSQRARVQGSIPSFRTNAFWLIPREVR